MPDVWSGLHGDLKRVIRTTWTEVVGPTHPIFRATQVRRRAWKEAFDRQELDAPWVVVQIPRVNPSTEFGVGNVIYRPFVTIYYVTKQAHQDTAAFIEEKLSALETALIADTATTFQMLPDTVMMDTSDENPANTVLIADNLPFLAGSLSFEVITGYVLGGGA